MLNHSGGARWSLWAKADAVGNGAAVVHGKPAGAASAASSTNPLCCVPVVGHLRPRFRKVVVSQVCAQPVSPLSLELVLEQLGVHALAFVAKPEQLRERTSHLARMGYDKRCS